MSERPEILNFGHFRDRALRLQALENAYREAFAPPVESCAYRYHYMYRGEGCPACGAGEAEKFSTFQQR